MNQLTPGNRRSYTPTKPTLAGMSTNYGFTYSPNRIQPDDYSELHSHFNQLDELAKGQERDINYLLGIGSKPHGSDRRIYGDRFLKGGLHHQYTFDPSILTQKRFVLQNTDQTLQNPALIPHLLTEYPELKKQEMDFTKLNNEKAITDGLLNISQNLFEETKRSLAKIRSASAVKGSPAKSPSKSAVKASVTPHTFDVVASEKKSLKNNYQVDLDSARTSPINIKNSKTDVNASSSWNQPQNREEDDKIKDLPPSAYRNSQTNYTASFAHGSVGQNPYDPKRSSVQDSTLGTSSRWNQLNLDSTKKEDKQIPEYRQSGLATSQLYNQSTLDQRPGEPNVSTITFDQTHNRTSITKDANPTSSKLVGDERGSMAGSNISQYSPSTGFNERNRADAPKSSVTNAQENLNRTSNYQPGSSGYQPDQLGRQSTNIEKLSEFPVQGSSTNPRVSEKNFGNSGIQPVLANSTLIESKRDSMDPSGDPFNRDRQPTSIGTSSYNKSAYLPQATFHGNPSSTSHQPEVQTTYIQRTTNTTSFGPDGQQITKVVTSTTRDGNTSVDEKVYPKGEPAGSGLTYSRAYNPSNDYSTPGFNNAQLPQTNGQQVTRTEHRTYTTTSRINEGPPVTSSYNYSRQY